MYDDFEWIKTRHLIKISHAIRDAETEPERKQFIRAFKKGLVQWIMIVGVVGGLSAAFALLDDRSQWTLALLAG